MQNLETAILKDSDIPDAYTNLAMAYGIAKAIYRVRIFRPRQAAFSARRLSHGAPARHSCKARFPVGSPGWVKADDIASFRPPASMQAGANVERCVWLFTRQNGAQLSFQVGGTTTVDSSRPC